MRDLREDLHAVVGAVPTAVTPARARLRSLNERMVAALAAASPRDGLPLAWELEVARGADLPDALALAALRLLRSPEVARVGRCSDAAVRWLYLDHSRNAAAAGAARPTAGTATGCGATTPGRPAAACRIRLREPEHQPVLVAAAVAQPGSLLPTGCPLSGPSYW